MVFRIRPAGGLGLRMRLFGLLLVILGAAFALQNGQWQPLVVSLVGLVLLVTGYRKIKI